MRRTLAILILLAIWLAQLAPASEIQWKGKDRWIRPACITLKKEGILVGYPTGLSSYQPTPMDYGSAVMASCERVERLLVDEEKQIAELAPLGGRSRATGTPRQGHGDPRRSGIPTEVGPPH